MKWPRRWTIWFLDRLLMRMLNWILNKMLNWMLWLWMNWILRLMVPITLVLCNMLLLLISVALNMLLFSVAHLIHLTVSVLPFLLPFLLHWLFFLIVYLALIWNWLSICQIRLLISNLFGRWDAVVFVIVVGTISLLSVVDSFRVHLLALLVFLLYVDSTSNTHTFLT